MMYRVINCDAHPERLARSARPQNVPPPTPKELSFLSQKERNSLVEAVDKSSRVFQAVPCLRVDFIGIL